MSKLKIIPIDTAVIVKIKKIKDVTESGIRLPENKIERDQQNIVDGYLAAIGDFAFEELNINNKLVPKIGDKVFFKRYSGILHEPEDKQEIFRIIQDIDIYAFESVESVEEVSDDSSK